MKGRFCSAVPRSGWECPHQLSLAESLPHPLSQHVWKLPKVVSKQLMEGDPHILPNSSFYEWLLVFFSWTASWWITITIHGVLPPRRHQHHLHRLHDLHHIWRQWGPCEPHMRPVHKIINQWGGQVGVASPSISHHDSWLLRHMFWLPKATFSCWDVATSQ